MKIVKVVINLNASFYKEMAAQGEMTRPEMKLELKREIKDQLAEYNWEEVLTGMIELPELPFECELCVKEG
jgi:hypothetical protein